MGFSGGGSNVLKSHTHDGTVAQDGGSLNMDNVTQGALSAGDVVYSDGVHLQRLAIGAATNVLEVNGGATAPQWAAAGTGGATLNYQTATTTVTQSTTSNAFVTLTGFSFTLAGAGAGNAVCNYNTNIMGTGTAPVVRWDFSVDGAQPESRYWFLSGNARYSTFFGCSATLSSQTAQMQFRCEAIGTVYVQMDNLNGLAYVLEIS